MIRPILKKAIPPVFLDFYRYFNQKHNQTVIKWLGDYASWEAAINICAGYNAPVILEKCKNALLKVKNGEAVYERDSVLFDEIQYSFALLSLLQRAALENQGNLCVLDFGGSLGSSYYQNKSFLGSIKKIKWNIVEQSNFVTCGKQYFENEKLRFYYTIEDCLNEQTPNVLLLSGVLQCLEKPYTWVELFLKLKISYIVVDRTAFIDNKEDILTVQHTPPSIYKASYPAWFFNIDKFKSYFEKNYTTIAQFDNGFTSPTIVNGKKAYWNGFIFKLKETNST